MFFVQMLFTLNIIFNKLLLIHGFWWMRFCFLEVVCGGACFSIISKIKLTSCLKLFSTNWGVVVVCIRSYLKGIRAASKSSRNFLPSTAWLYRNIKTPSRLFDLLTGVEILQNIGWWFAVLTKKNKKYHALEQSHYRLIKYGQLEFATLQLHASVLWLNWRIHCFFKVSNIHFEKKCIHWNLSQYWCPP